MILHTLVWESRTTPRFIWKASANVEAFSFTLPFPVPFGNNGLRFIPFLPRLSPRALRAGNPRRRDGMKLRQGEPFVRTPGPPSEGLPGGGHDLRKIAPRAGPYGGKGVGMTWGLACPSMRSRADKSECSESEAFVGTRGHRADGETFDSEREGGFRGRLQGGRRG